MSDLTKREEALCDVLERMLIELGVIPSPVGCGPHLILLAEDWLESRGAERAKREIADHPETNYLCSVCGSRQYRTPHGDVCENGHGGAPGELPY